MNPRQASAPSAPPAASGPDPHGTGNGNVTESGTGNGAWAATENATPGAPQAPIELRGRTVVPGTAEGEALVSPETISGWGGIDPARGVIIERRHPLHGQCFAGKVLVFPGAKGSSGWAGFFQSTRLLGTAPLAMIYVTTTTKAALGAVVTRVPTVTGLDQDPLTVIRTGDRVRVDADNGLICVYPTPPQ